MGTLLDTTVFIQLERRLRSRSRGDAMAGVAWQLAQVLGADDNVAMASITASELLHGVHRASPEYRARREAFVEAMIEGIPPVPFDLRSARIHARLWAELASAGTDIDLHDRIIAATALAHGLRLATGNMRHFERIHGLDVIQLDLT